MHRIDQRQLFAVTNGKHQWVPKDIADAAEKYAKVSFIGCQSLYAPSTFPIMPLTCPPPPPQILHNLCFSFLLGITAVPREIENNALQNFGGVNKLHYGKSGSGICHDLLRCLCIPSCRC